MALLVGISVAFAVAIFARIVGLDRERAFYSTVLIVVASYYILFAAMAGDRSGMQLEVFLFAVFAAIAVAGFRGSMWIVVAGLAAHGLLDFGRHPWVPAPGAPAWWPGFCGGFDIAAAAALAALLLLGKIRASPR